MAASKVVGVQGLGRSPDNTLHFTHYSRDSILAALPMDFVSALLARARPIRLQANKILFQKGDQGDGCYWLQTGVVKVTLPSSHGHGLDRILGILGPGAIVGGLSVVDGLARSATVETMTNSRLLFVSRTSFVERLHEDESVYAALVRTLA